jgi:hypothetical protein
VFVPPCVAVIAVVKPASVVMSELAPLPAHVAFTEAMIAL